MGVPPGQSVQGSVQRLTAGNLMANMEKVKVNQLRDRLALDGLAMATANTKAILQSLFCPMSRPALTSFVLLFFTSNHEVDQDVA